MSSGGMKNEVYTVRQVARMANVTIKTLHHYDAMALLRPLATTGAGYRLYGREQLERLQEILFYRELSFSLKDILSLITGARDRSEILKNQRTLLEKKFRDTAQLIETLDRTLANLHKGNVMPASDLFTGFQSEEQWKTALSPQNTHLNETYGVTVGDVIDVPDMNAAATEAVRFNSAMIAALKARTRHDDPMVGALVAGHLAWLDDHGHPTTRADFAARTQFFLDDDFHRDMLETWQVGLSYYLHAAARAFAAI